MERAAILSERDQAQLRAGEGHKYFLETYGVPDELDKPKTPTLATMPQMFKVADMNHALLLERLGVSLYDRIDKIIPPQNGKALALRYYVASLLGGILRTELIEPALWEIEHGLEKRQLIDRVTHMAYIPEDVVEYIEAKSGDRYPANFSKER